MTNYVKISFILLGAAGIPVAAQAVIGAIGGTVGAAVGGPLMCTAGSILRLLF